MYNAQVHCTLCKEVCNNQVFIFWHRSGSNKTNLVDNDGRYQSQLTPPVGIGDPGWNIMSAILLQNVELHKRAWLRKGNWLKG